MIVIAKFLNLRCPSLFFQQMTNNIRFTFNVGDTTWQFTISTQQDK